MTRRKERGRQLKRALKLINLLTNYHFGITKDGLAKRLKVGWRTIHRDIVAIREAGINIESYQVRYGPKKWRIKQRFQLRRAMGMH